MHSQTALNYSQALIEFATEKGILAEIRNASEDLLASLQISEVIDFLNNPIIPLQAKRDTLFKLILPATPVEFYNFLNLIMDRHRLVLLLPILEAVKDAAIKALGFEIIELVSAQDLSAVELDSVKKSLEQSWHTQLFIKYRINAKLIGGMIIRRGDQLIDGSLSGQINALKDLLIAQTEIPSVLS